MHVCVHACMRGSRFGSNSKSDTIADGNSDPKSDSKSDGFAHSGSNYSGVDACWTMHICGCVKAGGKGEGCS